MTVGASYKLLGDATAGEVFINAQGERLTPSVVHFGEDEELLVGQAAKNLQVRAPNRTVYGVKRLLGKSYAEVLTLVEALAFDAERPDLQSWSDWLWGNQMRSVGPCHGDFSEQVHRVAHESYRGPASPSFGGVCVRQWGSWWPVELVSALVLKEMKASAEAMLGRMVKKAVVTIPAYFGEPQKKATRTAAQIAGLDVLRLLAEPTAAAVSYARHKKADFRAAESLLIFDLGGGTFDVSILQYEGKGEFKVKAVTGDAQLGGEDLDVVIAEHLLEAYNRQHSLPDSNKVEMRRKLFPKFVRAGRTAKEKLSFQREVHVVVDGVAPGGDDFSLKLTRSRFEHLAKKIFARIVPIVKKGVSDAGMQLGDIDRVLTVGGSSRIPKVRELITQLFGTEPEQLLNPDESIADGAAVLAFQMANPGLLSTNEGGVFGMAADWAYYLGGDQAAEWLEGPVAAASHEIAVKEVTAHSLGVPYWAGDCTSSQIIGTGELAERLIREGARSGDVRISLMWNDYSDLDLHIVAPGGERIFYGHRRSACGGWLDVDANVVWARATAKPVENVFWPEGGAPSGEYKVIVQSYRDRSGAGGNSGSGSRFEGEVVVNGVATRFSGIAGGNCYSCTRMVEVTTFRFNRATTGQPASSSCERKVKVIVPRFSPLPFYAKPQSFVVPRSQRKVVVEVLEGDEAEVDANVNLGMLELVRDGSVSGSGEVKMQVTLGLDSDGIIDAKVKDMSTGQSKSVQLSHRKDEL
eukprot:CAMPEP_0185317098 /NCGR_PEP_ID=MMETSP1363-20130426/45903_1 /TAXON_ID=38817 /ORGANISM="Gephyrocapsa oceanica, Strain RCC1303" /LENGTH=747 /DNA_ID=CAMNT_0027915341 /DNA_START=172 /DNA_END=2415 /DNA_ORIENTATION=+